MADNNFSIVFDTSVANNIVNAFETGTYLCSAALAFTPVNGISSFNISGINVYGDTTNITVSANKGFPFSVVNGDTSDILFNVSFNNASPEETTFTQTACAGAVTGGASLSAGVTGTIQSDGVIYSSAFTISAENGWRGSDTGRIWPSHAEHTRMRYLGYI